MQGKANDPSCLCGLIPAPNSYRMSGLWSKTAGKNVDDSIRDADPKASARKGKHSPVGLSNLGNTCYINSVLQCLFAIDEFKYAIIGFSEPQLEKNDVFQSLRNIFVRMECGPRSYVDPEPLISALRLDSSVQQDGQEFMKLFLTLLERSFEGIPELEEKISKMFRGKAGYQTRCLTCQNLSQSSHRFDDFSELDIPIKGYKSLEESLGSLLAPEILDGDNQYLCEHCNCKRDATRQLVVKEMPPFLCLSLQRFVFDLKKMDRVKATDKFSFPLELDSATITHDYQQSNRFMYDLEGILLHKGSSARQGHYVAHVAVGSKGKGKNVWYRFDDTDVSKLESGSFGHADHGCRTKPPQKDQKKQSPSVPIATKNEQELQQEGVIDLSVDDYTSAVPNEECVDEHQDTNMHQHVTSSNAYLLVYKRRDASTSKKEFETIKNWIENQRGILEEEYKQECERHETIIADVQREVDARRTMVRNAIDASKCLAADDSGRFIVSNWLDTWANAEPKDSIVPAGNAVLLCNHGKFDPSRVQASKRLASDVSEQLMVGSGSNSGLSLTDICKICLLEQLNSIIVADDVAINRQRYLDVCKSLDAENQGSCVSFDFDRAKGYYVGKHWLRNWRNRKGMSMGTTSPTALLVCPHGLLLPEHPGKPSRHVLIPEDFWQYLKRCWVAQNAEKDRKLRFKEAERGTKQKGGSVSKDESAQNTCEDTTCTDEVEIIEDGNRLCEFARDCPECEECRAAMAVEMCINQEFGARWEEEKSALKHVIPSQQNIVLEPNIVYKLIPLQFLHEWRAHMQGSTKGKSMTEPPKLEPFMKSLACLSHTYEDGLPRIAYSAPNIINRRGRWMAVSDTNCAFEVIQESDWAKLWSIYGNEHVPFGSDGISVFLSIKTSVESSVVSNVHENPNEMISSLDEGNPEGNRCSDQIPQVAAATNTLDGKDVDLFKDASNVTLVTSPEICLKCIEDRHQAIHASLLQYEGKGIMVELVPDEATAISDTTVVEQRELVSNKIANSWQIQNAQVNDTVVSAHERKSKRARKGRSPVTVDSSTSLHDLKLRTFEALGVHPKNIRVFAKGKELGDDSKTMLQYEIFPMEELRILDTQEYDANDLTSLFPDMPQHQDKGKEEGFTGTALVG